MFFLLVLVHYFIDSPQDRARTNATSAFPWLVGVRDNFFKYKLRICGPNCLLNWPGNICKFYKPQHVVQLIGVHCCHSTCGTDHFVGRLFSIPPHPPLMQMLLTMRRIRLKVLNLFQCISFVLLFTSYLSIFIYLPTRIGRGGEKSVSQLGICNLKILKFRLFSSFIRSNF